MKSVPPGFSYSVPEDERAAFSELCRQPWTKFAVSGGAIGANELEPHVYSVIQLIIEGGITALILLDSEDVAVTELYRIAIVHDKNRLEEMKSHVAPRFSELRSFPADLRINRFLNEKNNVSIIRFNVEIEDGKGGVLGEAVVDAGLLISNKNDRMVLYANSAIPLDIALTTDEAKIVELLSKADSIDKLNLGV